MKINGYRDMKRNVRVKYNKTFLSVVGLSILSLLLLIVAFTPNAAAVDAAAVDCSTCHSTYVNEIAPTYHGGVNECIFCHTGYLSSPWTHLGTTVTETKCRGCHVDGVDGFYERHSSSSDCTQCHFANTTQAFELDPSLYKHSHNLTVEYNYYNYNLNGMPLQSNNGAGIGMFPYYTCTLTCHITKSEPLKIDNASSSWLGSAHANSRHGSSDSKNSCAKCKSPPNFNGNDSDTTAIAAADWQGIQCRVCHNLHDRKYPNNTGPSGFPVAFYNSTNSSLAGHAVYDAVTNATELCEKCHFPYSVDPANATHDSNYAGIHKDPSVNFTCVNCHMNSTFSDSLHKFEVKNTISGVTGCEVCHDYTDSHVNFTERSYHDDKVDCVACHDQTITTNATGYAVYVFPANASYSYGLWNVSGNWTTYAYYNKKSSSVPASWPLHNITRNVACTKCHNATSVFNGTIAPELTCSSCHPSYASAVNSSQHNQTLNPGAPANCTVCHAGYLPGYRHTTGNRSYIVNESNTCTQAACHASSGSAPVNESHGNHNYGQNYADCTQCHFANTTQQFSLNSSLYTHDHNLTVEYNYYNYNLYGFPTESDHSAGKKGMFPYYTCTLTCHNGTGVGQPKIEDEVVAWSQSGHAQVSGSYSYNWTNRTLNRSDLTTQGCITCKSPTQFNTSIQMKVAIPDWQGIQCRVCHNLHNDTYSGNGTTPINIAFYNGTLSNWTRNATYDTVSNATELCEKCHQGYHNKVNYTGSHKTDLGFTCASCHMNSTINSGATHTFEVNNIATGSTGCEACHQAEDHTFQFTSNHTGKATCEACHDMTVSRNASGYAMTDDRAWGLYNDTATGLISTFKYSSSKVPSTNPLYHNISGDVSCNKCHGTLSNVTGLLAPTFGTIGCVKCHPSYASAVNNSMHNNTVNTAAPGCTDCHTGYDANHTGYTGYIVNESNTCVNCHNSSVSGFEENHTGSISSPADCTQCHFANTTRAFTGFNSSLYTHDHNLTVEYNFYNYNISGMPLESDHGASKKGMFPYYTCTLTCHNGTGSGQPKIENETSSWNQSAHARSLVEPPIDQTNSCARCKSPANYNVSASSSTLIPVADWQGIQCRVCHDMHNISYSNPTGGKPLAFYNATATSNKTTNPSGASIYDRVHNATELCEKCHSGSKHDSKYAGFHKDTLGFDCADCHANTTFNNATHLFEVKNTTSGATGCEACHNSASHTFQFTSLHENIVTCEACHDNTVARNSSDFVVNVGSGMAAGIYKDPSTNKWTTYKVDGGAVTWPLHNISKSIDCNKCHGARSVYSGAIAPNLTSGGTTYYTTDTLVTGYNLILLLLNPSPTLNASNLLYTSSSTGIPGVTKVLKWDSAGQTWVSYQYIVPSSGTAFYYGTNFTMDGYKAYFIKGNATTAGKTYTFVGTK